MLLKSHFVVLLKSHFVVLLKLHINVQQGYLKSIRQIATTLATLFVLLKLGLVLTSEVDLLNK